MFLHADIKGVELPAKTLALTFDDGPGPQTAALAAFLAEAGIEATFFVIGKHAEEFRETLTALHRCRHAIGNHTYSHPGLVAFAESGGDVVAEIARTDALIRQVADEQPIYFRAPYGNWRQIDEATHADKRHSIIAELLNASRQFHDYIGPINWDISAEDFAFWRRGASAEEAAEAYLCEIERVGRGIVLLHDSSNEATVRGTNRAVELVTLLIPSLLKRGFRFVTLDELPEVKRLVATRNLEMEYVAS